MKSVRPARLQLPASLAGGLGGAATRAWTLSTATLSATTARTVKVCRPGLRIVVTSQLLLSPKYQGELWAVHAWKPSIRESTSVISPCEVSICGYAIQWLRSGRTLLPSSDDVTVKLVSLPPACAEGTETTAASNASKTTRQRTGIFTAPRDVAPRLVRRR